MLYCKKSRGLAQAIAIIFSILTSNDALACSICRCGDPTFNALGMEGVPQSGLRLALDVDRLGKSQGSAALDNVEELTEERITLLAAYSVTERVALFARVPYSQRNLKGTSGGEVEQVKTAGLADPELYGQVRVWSSPFEGDVGQRVSLFAVGGIKASWGDNNVQHDGARGDEHIQLGTGSTDWFGGLAGSYQLNRKSALFSSVQYRATGGNDAGYRYGNVVLANLAYEYKLTARWDTAVELNYRYASRDSIDNDGNVDDNTGGLIAFVTPRVLFRVGGNWVLRTAVQIPLSQSGLNGAQHESAVLNIGVTYLMGQE